MDEIRQVDLKDEAATARLGRRLAERARAGDVLALEGGLGAGKTALARAFVRRLAGEEEEVPSPTFTLVQCYDCEAGTIWHFDLYRLDRPEDALELGLEDALYDGIVLIEWPERLGVWLPATALRVRLDAGADGVGRVARLDGGAAWDGRLEGLT